MADTWSAIGSASSGAEADENRDQPRKTSSTDSPRGRPMRRSQRHERVEQQREQRGDDEQQQDDARRAQQRVGAEHGERQRDELDPARDDDRFDRAAAAGTSTSSDAPCSGSSLMIVASSTVPTSILFVGDVVASPGRHTLRALLPGLREELGVDFVVVNGENAAGGVGITAKTAADIFAAGADAITLGNHTYRHREVYRYLDDEPRIVRPANFLPSQPGRGTMRRRARRRAPGSGQRSAATCTSNAARPAFVEIESALAEVRGRRPRLVDVHAEATSEKVAMGWLPRRARDRRGRERTPTSPPTTPACSRAAPRTSPTSG